MKNPNTPIKRLKKSLLSRWSGEDYPGAEPRFHYQLFAKDVSIFLLLPLISILLFKSCESAVSNPRKIKRSYKKSSSRNAEGLSSQIINFLPKKGSSSYKGIIKKSPGSLVKVRLLNTVETYSKAPVHAQIIDVGLGRRLLGGTLIGEATPDINFDRVNIIFKYVKHPRLSSLAIPIAARALSLNGTLGLVARKKEGYFARSAIGAASVGSGNVSGAKDKKGLKDYLLGALVKGLSSEFKSDAKVAQNRSHVLAVSASKEFYVELTDFFPGAR